MHVIHDDILPLYHTLRQFSFSKDLSFDWRLVLMEGQEAGEHLNLYKLLSSDAPLLKRDIVISKRLTCFQHSLVGVSKFTTWYQYGFKVPQGPLPRISVTGSHIRQFTTFISEQLNVSKPPDFSGSTYMVLYSRRHNRLILNEVDVALALAAKFNTQVMQISMETHSFKEQVELISHACALIGMHGSALILAMFLPPGAAVVELFPYGINPDHYTPFHTLAGLPGIGLSYAAWRNTIEHNSVTHPGDAGHAGDIHHLSEEEQTLIQNTKEVPQHLCCSNAYWLFRIYQDTFVDIPSFLQTMEYVFSESKILNAKVPEGMQYPKLLPAKVVNITCKVHLAPDVEHPSLLLSWEQPINANVFELSQLKYEVWIQKNGREEYAAYVLEMTEYVFKENLEKHTEYNVWIRCLVNDEPGPFGEMIKCRSA